MDLKVTQGKTIRLPADFYSGDNRADPTNPRVKVVNPKGVAVVRDATPARERKGVYRFDYKVEPDAPLGIWQAVWSAEMDGRQVRGSDPFEVLPAAKGAPAASPRKAETAPAQPPAVPPPAAGAAAAQASPRAPATQPTPKAPAGAPAAKPAGTPQPTARGSRAGAAQGGVRPGPPPGPTAKGSPAGATKAGARRPGPSQPPPATRPAPSGGQQARPGAGAGAAAQPGPRQPTPSPPRAGAEAPARPAPAAATTQTAKAAAPAVKGKKGGRAGEGLVGDRDGAERPKKKLRGRAAEGRRSGTEPDDAGSRAKLSRGKALLIVGGLAVVLLAIWLSPRRNDTVQARIDQGVAAQKAGRTDEAERIYREVLNSDPDNKLANFNLGVSAHVAGRLEEAETLYNRSLRADPDFLPALFNMAILHETLGRNDQAEATYRTIIEAYPDNGPAHLNLGFLLTQKLNRPDDGRAELARAVELDSSLANRIPPELRPADPPPPPAPAP